MAPSQNPYNDPAHTGQAPNMFLTNVGRQAPQDQRRPPFMVAAGQFGSHGPGTLSSRSTEFSDDPVESPNMSNISWEDSAATWWEEHARMLEQQGHDPRGMPLNDIRFTSAPGSVDFPAIDHGLNASATALSDSSTLGISLSASLTPGSEVRRRKHTKHAGAPADLKAQMVPTDTFTSPLTPSSFVPETHSLQPTQHRHIHSTPSPGRVLERAELSRHTSAPTRSKSSTAAPRVSKNSPKTSTCPPPPNSRSAHSAIERKYRENINSKIGELHKVLCSAAGLYYPDPDNEPGGYPYARVQRPEEDDDADSGSVAGSTTLPAKKADVLAGAVAYVRRSEREKRMMAEQLRIATLRLRQYDQAMAQAQSRGMGV